MAQTKRKRRTKHRGNAAGAIEARGRTGRKPTAEEQKASDKRQQRQRKPPSWSGAAAKAGAMAVLLFALTQFGILGSKSTTLAQSIFLSLIAFVIYTPLAFVTDKWVYNRMLRNQGQQPAKKR
jgi:hypothetical protein